MKLWLVKRKDRVGYDEYDSMVVAAETEEDAKLIHPNGYAKAVKVDGRYTWFWNNGFSGEFHGTPCWGAVKDLSVEYLGTTDRDIEGVVLASFNAG